MERVKFISQMREAIKENDIKKVKELLNADKEKLNLVLPTGSWLNLAITCKATDIIEYLLEQEIDKEILIASTKGNALSSAAAVGTPELIQSLLSHGIKLICDCNASNPIFSAIRGNNVSTLKYLLTLEEESLGDDEYLQLRSWIIEEAKIISNDSILELMGEKCKEKNDLFMPQIDKVELQNLFVKILKNTVVQVLKEYQDSNIYIMSLEIDETDFSCYLYVNTKENLATKLKSNNGEHKWYYYFCENEWHILKDSPEYFEQITEYMKKLKIKPTQLLEVYDIVTEAVATLRHEKFFEKTYKNKIIFSLNAYEICESNEIIKLFKKMNDKEDCLNYEENIEEFF